MSSNREFAVYRANLNVTGEVISVIVPAYNSGSTLDRCLHALKYLDDERYEVIVVDDGSNDNSLELCDDYPFHTVSLPFNKGQAYARNAGVSKSRGEIIAFVDSDIIPPRTWISTFRKLLIEHPEAAMICSGYSGSLFDSNAAWFACYETLFRRKKLSFYIQGSTGSNMITYKNVFNNVGGYPVYYLDPERDPEDQKALATVEDRELGFLYSRRDYVIAWSHENNVPHFFRKTWQGYLRQQENFVKYSVISLFRFPAIVLISDIYGGERVTHQLLLSLFVLVSPLLMLMEAVSFPTIMVVNMLILLVFGIQHREYIDYLHSRNNLTCAKKELFFWIVLTRFFWLKGALAGLYLGSKMWIKRLVYLSQ